MVINGLGKIPSPVRQQALTLTNADLVPSYLHMRQRAFINYMRD